MILTKGDIVRFHSAIAGKEKYHLCVLENSKDCAAAFLFINSKSGWKGDLVLADSDIPCLPKSPTGQSVISCSQLVRVNAKNLALFGSQTIGRLSPAVARKLEKFVATVPTLTAQERKIVLNALSVIR